MKRGAEQDTLSRLLETAFGDPRTLASALPPPPRSARDRRYRTRHELHQLIDVAADYALTRLHALDCRDRQARKLGQPALVDPEQGTGSAELRSSYHV